MRAAIGGAIVLGMLVAGCSQPAERQSPEQKEAPETAAASVPKACDLLTETAAETALGREVERLPNEGGPAGLDICQYGYQGERIADMGNVSVTVQPVDLASVIEAARAQGYALEPVQGLGDVAYYSADVGLYVGKGQRTAHYLLAANGMEDPRNRVIALARDTVGRL